GVIAVVSRVHVRAEHPVLGPVASELDSQTGLLDLPLERPVTRALGGSDEPLGDRGRALDALARALVFDRRTHDDLGVDAAAPVPAPRWRRVHAKPPAARRRSCARSRSSLSSRSASIGPSAAARTTIVAVPSSAVTATSGADSAATASRSSSTTARRSLPK